MATFTSKARLIPRVDGKFDIETVSHFVSRPDGFERREALEIIELIERRCRELLAVAEKNLTEYTRLN